MPEIARIEYPFIRSSIHKMQLNLFTWIVEHESIAPLQLSHYANFSYIAHINNKKRVDIMTPKCSLVPILKGNKLLHVC